MELGLAAAADNSNPDSQVVVGGLKEEGSLAVAGEGAAAAAVHTLAEARNIYLSKQAISTYNMNQKGG